MIKVVVLGAGLVGSAIAIDLSKKFDVTSVDINQSALDLMNNNYGIKIINSNLKKEENVKNIVKNFDLVISAVPGFMGFNTLKYIIELIQFKSFFN